MSEPPRTRGRHLNHVAWLYDPVLEKLSFGREQRFRDKTIVHMRYCPADRVLDVGCGTGSLTLLVAAGLEPPGSIVGIDAAPRMIDIARRKAANSGSRARFRVGVAEKLDCADCSFDLVVNSMFLHHLDTELKTLALAEMYRVLRPGGRLVTADIDRPSTRMAWLIGWGARFLLFQKELKDNLRGELPRLIHEAGFADVRRKEHLYGLVSFFTARRPEAGR